MARKGLNIQTIITLRASDNFNVMGIKNIIFIAWKIIQCLYFFNDKSVLNNI